jgi:hypothetical protein
MCGLAERSRAEDGNLGGGARCSRYWQISAASFNCAYCLCFRWERIRRKYGLLDLLWWPTAVVSVFSLAGWAIDLALWLALQPA